jgi:hypothetical protein
VGIATTLRGNLIVGARAFDGNPYDGHTLAEQIEQATILMQDTGVKPNTAWVDLGYRGVDAENPAIQIKHRGKKRPHQCRQCANPDGCRHAQPERRGDKLVPISIGGM